jgi:glycosyltransferase involved in cell wall biosynthesis
MKKIIFIVTQSEFGGAQRYVFEITKILKENYDILVAAGEGDGELFNCLKIAGINSCRLISLKRSPAPWQMVASIKEITNLLKKEKPDVLFLCSTTAGLLGSIVSKKYKKKNNLKTVYRIGGWAFNDPRSAFKNQLIILAEKATAKFKDVIIVNSEFDWRIAVKKRICSPEKIIKIYNGLNPEKIQFLDKQVARQKLKIEDGFIIGTVANFYKPKGLEYLIEAFGKSILKEKTNLVIIGDGRFRPQLESLIRQYKLENQVQLLGRIPNARDYLKAFDLFILPSLKEGFPWIILEAMAAELPIIATKVGALPEIIDNNINGLLIKPANCQEIVEKIKWILDNQDKAKDMGIKAKTKLIEKFSLQKMAKETEKTIS